MFAQTLQVPRAAKTEDRNPFDQFQARLPVQHVGFGLVEIASAIGVGEQHFRAVNRAEPRDLERFSAP